MIRFCIVFTGKVKGLPNGLERKRAFKVEFECFGLSNFRYGFVINLSGEDCRKNWHKKERNS